MIVTIRTCLNCMTIKNAVDFYTGRAKCKACCSNDARTRYVTNGDASKARVRAYKKANRQHVRDACNKYDAQNRDAVNTRRANWKRNNKHKVRAWVAKRRAAKLQATPAWSDAVKIAEYYFAADFLGMVTGEWYEVDHIVPLQSEIVCGMHWENNLQVLTEHENRIKHNRYWPDMP